MRNTVLGIDLGTQSLKAVFYDYETREIAAVTSSPLEVDRDSSGKAEQQAHWWLQALADCMQQAGTKLLASVRAVGVSGQQHGFVPLDATGKVLAPVKLWCDTATQPEVEQLTRKVGGRDQAIALTGNPILAGYTAPKILWLKNHRPEYYARMQHILLPHDYLNYILTGEFAMEFGDASGTGLMDIRTRQWSQEILQILDTGRDLAACLPPLYSEDSIIGTLSKKASSEYGLPSGIPVSAGGGDNMMGAIGTGNVREGQLTVSLGSSGTLYAHSDEAMIDPKGEIAAFCSSTGGWLPLLCTMNCTLATEYIRRPLDISLADFDHIVGKAPAGSQGLTMLPFFNGERTPELPDAKAGIYGMNAENFTRENLLRATVEATCFSLKYGLDRLRHLGLNSEELVLTGGGSKSRVWRQIISDIFNMPVHVLKNKEGASFGAALQALWVLKRDSGENISLETVCQQHLEYDTSLSTQPETSDMVLYKEAYQRYHTLLQHMTPLMRSGQ